MNNDPYDEYRQEPMGCGHIALAVLAMIALIVFAYMTSSCSTQRPLVQVRDSIRVEMRHDSIYVYQHDSVFRDRWRNGDTIYIQVEKYQVIYKDKMVQVHDTIATTHTEQVAVKYVPNYYKNTSAGFWVLLVILLALIGWRIYKIYIKIKTGGTL